jgi:hypothetical protein
MLLRVGIGLIVVGVIAGIAAAIFWDGPDRDRTIEYRVVETGDTAAGEDPGVVVVSDEDWDGPRFFPAIPLLVIGGVLVAIALISQRRGGWGDPRSRFEEWHREAHPNGSSTQPSGG